MIIFLIVITIIIAWIIFIRLYNHYYDKTNFIKIIGFRIIDNQPCILIKYNTNVDNVIIEFKADEQNNSGTLQAKKGNIKMYFPTTVRPPCRLYSALVTVDGILLAKDNRIFFWGWKNNE